MKPMNHRPSRRLGAALLAGAVGAVGAACMLSTPAQSQSQSQAMPAGAGLEQPHTSTAEQILVGTWFGEAVLPGTPETLQQFLATRRADGSYTLEVRNYQEGRMRQRLVNSGVWSISNGIFVTLTTDIEGKKTTLSDPSFTQVFAVRGLTANEFRYQHLASGREIRVVRSTPDFRLPD